MRGEGRGFHQARADLQPEQVFVVIPAAGGYPLADGVPPDQPSRQGPDLAQPTIAQLLPAQLQLGQQAPGIGGRQLLFLAGRLGGDLIEQAVHLGLDGRQRLCLIAVIQHRAIEGDQAIVQLFGVAGAEHHLAQGLQVRIRSADQSGLGGMALLLIGHRRQRQQGHQQQKAQAHRHRQPGAEPLAAGQPGIIGIKDVGQMQQRQPKQGKG